ncbi:MAG: radical SAM protein [Gracilibacteraceae bacterium]|jgi:putative heme d1 biosynthesis radical SAM protein NirJ1|nr:radical SAM protein [Gracilibacteraceae bacterium]
MISVSKMLYETEHYGDELRYAPEAREQRHGAARSHGPVVVWNCTRTCNLRCRHCYTGSDSREYEQMDTKAARAFIDDLAAFRVPVLLLSGGEPLLRGDWPEIIAYARACGLRVTLSTNGTLITAALAARIKELGVSYVGVSLDGPERINDEFRGRRGAFAAALAGLRHCIAAGQKVGLRFTLNRHNHRYLDDIFDLAEQENIPRICFYHLVYTGRGSAMAGAEDLSHAESRAALDVIIRRTEALRRSGRPREVLTVDNHADAAYIYLDLRRRDGERAERALELLKTNGGNRSGIAIAQVDWLGNVHPDQFTAHCLGNVRERKFGDIWTDQSNPILAGLKDRRPLLHGRCAACRWLDICNGNFRARAEAQSGDFWAADPACYLTDEEIGL